MASLECEGGQVVTLKGYGFPLKMKRKDKNVQLTIEGHTINILKSNGTELSFRTPKLDTTMATLTLTVNGETDTLQLPILEQIE